MSTRRIATAALTGRIYRGRVAADRQNFIGEKEDVTSDVLKAVIDKATYHGGEFTVEGDGKKWQVIVKELQ